DATLPGLYYPEQLLELVELRVAADHRRAHTGEAAGVHGALLEAGDLVGADSCRFARVLELTYVDGLDEPADEAVGGRGDEDAARARGGLHAGGHVDGVTHRRVLGGGLGANGADHDRAGVDANPHPKLVRFCNVVARVELVDGAKHVEAATHGGPGVRLVGGWRPEEGEDAIAHEGCDVAAVPPDG